MAYSGIALRWTPPALRVTLDRPDRGNTVDGTLLAELHRALDEAEARDECRLVVLDARGSVFCAGMDMGEAARSDSDPSAARVAERAGAFFGLLRRFTEAPRVVLSCVDGRVAGGGVGLVAASDLVHSTERGVFTLPEALWGLLPCSLLPFLIRRAGFQAAYAMTLSMLPVSAAQAAQCRLVDEVSPDPDGLIRRLGSRLSKLDRTLVADAKRYFGRLQPITEEMEDAAVAEFDRLAGAAHVRKRFAAFAETGRYPWEA